MLGVNTYFLIPNVQASQSAHYHSLPLHLLLHLWSYVWGHYEFQDTLQQIYITNFQPILRHLHCNR